MEADEGLGRDAWREKLDVLGATLDELNRPLRLVIIGAWPVIQAGMPSRSTMDLDIWGPTSEIDESALRKACAKANLDYDPLGEVDRPYLQIVWPGIVQIPEHQAAEVGRWGGLTLCVPPPAALVAAKLTRAESKDLADILFLSIKFKLTQKDVRVFVEKIVDRRQRETAEENLVYLEVVESNYTDGSL